MQDIKTIKEFEAARAAAAGELRPELKRLRDAMLRINPEWELYLNPRYDGKGLYLNCNDTQLVTFDIPGQFYQFHGTGGSRFCWDWRGGYDFEECLKTAVHIMNQTPEDIDRRYLEIASCIGLR